MRYLVSSLLLFLTLLPCFASDGVISRSVLNQLDNSAPDDTLRIIVRMSERPDVEFLHECVKGLPRKERTKVVREILSELAESSQVEILAFLDVEQDKGNVYRYSSIKHLNDVMVHAKPCVIKSISNRSDIHSIIRDYPTYIPEPPKRYTGRELDEIGWGVEQIGAPDVWESGYTGEGVIVAILDSGVDYYHADLADHMWDGGDEYRHHGYDFRYDDDDPIDTEGHGTNCAGLITGDGTNGNQTGVAPGATLMAISSRGFISYQLEAHDFAIEQNVDITTTQLIGIPDNNNERAEYRNSCDILLEAGIISVASAGNSGGNIDELARVPSPWRHPDEVEEGGRSSLISVGASDSRDSLCDFSSRNPVTWQNVPGYEDYLLGNGHVGMIVPDIIAPGEDNLTLTIGGGYTWNFTGTSGSAPQVAGVLALMLSKNYDLLPVELDSILQVTALDLGGPGKENGYGAGRVRADLAVAHTPPPSGFLQGHVSNFNNNEPVENAIIRITEYEISDTTDATGWFSLRVPMGYSTLSCDHAPFESFQRDSVFIERMLTTEIDIELKVGIFSCFPDSFDLSIGSDTTIFEQFCVYNSGSADMTVLLELNQGIDDSIAWVTLENDSFCVSVNDSFTTQIAFDSHDLLDSTYTCSLVASQNTLNSIAVIPLRLLIESNSKLETNPQHSIPDKFALGIPYPNPFNSITSIQIEIPTSAWLKLAIYNILGQQVAKLADNQIEAGYHQFVFDGANFSSGIYFVRMEVPRVISDFRKIVLMK